MKELKKAKRYQLVFGILHSVIAVVLGIAGVISYTIMSALENGASEYAIAMKNVDSNSLTAGYEVIGNSFAVLLVGAAWAIIGSALGFILVGFTIAVLIAAVNFISIKRQHNFTLCKNSNREILSLQRGIKFNIVCYSLINAGIVTVSLLEDPIFLVLLVPGIILLLISIKMLMKLTYDIKTCHNF